MNDEHPLRSFGYGTVVSAATGVGVLVLWYVFALPTIASRTRIHMLVTLAPVGWLFLVGGVLLLLGFTIVWATGWRTTASGIGALAGALLGVAAFRFQVLVPLVWRYEQEASLKEQLLRAFLAVAVPVLVAALARRGLPKA
jgi:hypothetical protein